MAEGRMVLQSNLFPALARKLPKAVGRLALRAAERVRTHAVRSMATPKHGRLYRKGAIRRKYAAGGKRAADFMAAGMRGSESGGKVIFTVGYKTHRASAPGESPAIDLANLRSSISVGMTGESTAMVAVNADYGPHLEFGTRKMARRPFIRPAVDAVAPQFENDLRNLENELR